VGLFIVVADFANSTGEPFLREDLQMPHRHGSIKLTVLFNDTTDLE
jgi:hypothetical protein